MNLTAPPNLFADAPNTFNDDLPHRSRVPSARRSASSPVRMRRGRIGDLGWVFHRQVVVYHEEFGYSQVFERYFARGLAPFLDNFDAGRDALWIAEHAGRPVGSIAIQHDHGRRGWAKLRWYFVEAEARGMGVGRRLMQTALRFARQAGYEGVALWTVDDLHAARRVYEASGFALAEQTIGCDWAPWGHEQRWELRFSSTATAPPGRRAARKPSRGTAPKH